VEPEYWLDRHVSSTLMFAEGGWHDATGQAWVRLGSPLSTNGVNEAINLAGGVAARYTLLLAPLVLVQALPAPPRSSSLPSGLRYRNQSRTRVGEDLSPRSPLQKGACMGLAASRRVLAGG
jgi:hypothetical protein